MAKKKYNGLSSKHFFNIVVLSASALGLMLAVMVVQKPTNTRSNAAEIAGCRNYPTLKSAGTNTGANSVTYIYKVGFPSNGCSSILYGLQMQTPSTAWSIDYKKNDGPWVSNYAKLFVTGTLKLGTTDTIKIKVSPPPGAVSKSYNLYVHACNAYKIEVGVYDLGNNCVTKTATYIKD